MEKNFGRALAFLETFIKTLN